MRQSVAARYAEPSTAVAISAKMWKERWVFALTVLRM